MTLQRFMTVMKRKLKENERKGGWHGKDWEYLLQQAREELNELHELLKRGDAKPKQVAREAADVANSCYMIADNADAKARIFEKLAYATKIVFIITFTLYILGRIFVTSWLP